MVNTQYIMKQNMQNNTGTHDAKLIIYKRHHYTTPHNTIYIIQNSDYIVHIFVLTPNKQNNNNTPNT